MKKILFLILKIWGMLFISIILSTASCNAAETNIAPTEMQKLLNTVAIIHKYYVNPVSDDKLIASAINGMLTELDPHSSYLNSDDLNDLDTAISGKFDGVGLTVIPDSGVLKVISPLDGSPAQKAGIKPGDLIVKIENQLVTDIPMEKAIDMLRGPEGSKVNIYIIRKPEIKPLKFTIARSVINVPTVKEELLDNHYGYLRIAIFYQTTDIDLRKAIYRLQKQAKGNLQGIILDLRNNPGGIFDPSVQIADEFLDADKLTDNNLIVTIKGTGRQEIFHATPKELLPDLPIIILINEGSASAAEIVAGALQDHKRALIVGTRSFGKGSVQSVFPLDSKSAIKLTTSLYYTPSGRSIQAKGIAPDIVINELEVGQVKDSELPFGKLYEENLQNHLANSSQKKSESSQEYSETELLQKDFQLYEALLILKSRSSQ